MEINLAVCTVRTNSLLVDVYVDTVLDEVAGHEGIGPNDAVDRWELGLDLRLVR
jgi:hypothetical protein